MTKQQIVSNWLPRYTGEENKNFGEYILLTNFSNYVEMFATMHKTKVIGAGKPFQCATASDITIINFGMGSPGAATVMDLLAAINPKAVLFLGKCGGIQALETPLHAHRKRNEIEWIEDHVIVARVALPLELPRTTHHHERLDRVVGVHEHALARRGGDERHAKSRLQVRHLGLGPITKGRVRALGLGLIEAQNVVKGPAAFGQLHVGQAGVAALQIPEARDTCQHVFATGFDDGDGHGMASSG